MPGLMSIREEYGDSKPLNRRKNCGLFTHDYSNSGYLLKHWFI